MHGHEGLGQVTSIGTAVFNVQVGDFVATRGEPAFAEYYNAPVGTFVKVPEASPQYILEPVACAINIGRAAKLNQTSKVCIIGTGFLARCLFEYIVDELAVKIDVVGKSNTDYWCDGELKDYLNFKQQPEKEYDVVYDLSADPKHFENITVKDNGFYIVGAEKSAPASTDFSKFLWNNITIKCPSPRDTHFISCMKQAEEYVKRGIISTEEQWTHEFTSDRIDVAFAENISKKPGMGRSYIKWN